MHTITQTNSLKPEGFRASIYSLLLCTLVINILSLALPIMTLQVYDRILPNPGTGTLSVLIISVCVAILLETTLRLTRSYIIGRSGASYEHLLACKAMNKILNADLTKMKSSGIGEHLHRMSEVGKLKDFYNGYSLTVLADLAFVPIFFALIFYIGKEIVIIPTVVLGGFIAFSFWKGRQLRQSLSKRQQVDDTRFNFLIEALEGIHTIKSFALEKFFQRRYEELEKESTSCNHRVAEQTARTFNAGTVFAHIMVIATIIAGAIFILSGQLSTGGMIAILLLSGRVMQPAQKALSLWTRYQDYLISRQNIQDIFATPQQIIIPRVEAIPNIPEGKLDIHNMDFQYSNETTPIFSHVNLHIKRGESILISGAHGSGKTTLLHVIAGIYPPTNGDITIDGHPINSYKREELVNHIGYIRSEPLIFRGTIRDNITCFGQTNEHQAQEVAALLQVDQDIAKLPSGFDTFLTGNDTDNISPGLKQRISITRVLATKPRLILFDNADYILDEGGYAMIYSLLARLKNKASIILTSDDQNIRALAERHYEIKDGTLQQQLKPCQNNIHPYRELRL